MPIKRSALVVSALAAAAAALPAHAAEAKTYCVSKLDYTCPAGSIWTNESLQYALNLAQADKEADTIKIGPGTFTSPSEGWQNPNDHPLTVTGSKGTILDATGQTVQNPAFQARSATVERFKLLVSGLGLHHKGIVTRLGEVRDVTVVNPGKTGQGIASQGSTIRRVNVQMTGEAGIGIHILPDFLSTSVIASNVTADGTAIVANRADGYVTRTRTYGSGVVASGGDLNVTDTIIRLGDSDGAGVSATCAAEVAVSTLTADHLTVLGGAKTHGATARCLATGVSSKTVIKNSILATGISVTRSENAGRSDVLAYNNLLGYGDKTSKDLGPAYTGKINLGVNHLGTPTFAPGSVALPSGSFLIDKALPSNSVWDASNKPRPKDGNGDGVAAGDIGALERQVP